MKTHMRSELEKSLQQLRTLRDEIRVRIHLGSLEAKDAWSALLPRLEEAERTAEGAVTDTARAAVDEVISKLQDLRDRIPSRKRHTADAEHSVR
jgi:hypothetical protein